MNILFTGASSFTGMWFVKELAESGHNVTAIFSKNLEDYEDLRQERILKILDHCKPVFSCKFGEPKFFETIASASHFDMLCHHAADVTNYKSPDFDVAAALANNTKNLPQVLQSLKLKGCKKVLLTGSVFEQREGQGSDVLRAVSPYGLSKGLSSDVFQFYCHIYNMKLGKFVIPNPFGPYEEPRFTTFLIKSWYEGKTPPVSAPDYSRDNIPVSLLAKTYLNFATNLNSEPGYEKINPSFYAGKQGEFTLHFAKEMEKRLKMPCKVELQKQTTFPEPEIRTNTDPIDLKQVDWNEEKAWDELAEYYKTRYSNAKTV